METILAGGGITLKAQPLDLMVSKTFKGKQRECYDFNMLNAPQNEKGNPRPPSRQLLAKWTVEAWWGLGFCQ